MNWGHAVVEHNSNTDKTSSYTLGLMADEKHICAKGCMYSATESFTVPFEHDQCQRDMCEKYLIKTIATLLQLFAEQLNFDSNAQ